MSTEPKTPEELAAEALSQLSSRFFPGFDFLAGGEVENEIAAAIRKQAEQDIRIVLAEAVDAASTGTESDEAYNLALQHAAHAIRRACGLSTDAVLNAME